MEGLDGTLPMNRTLAAERGARLEAQSMSCRMEPHTEISCGPSMRPMI
jgi:hypothetical protein